VQIIGGLQAFVVVLQPTLPQSVSFTKPDLSALQICKLLPLHLCSPAEHTLQTLLLVLQPGVPQSVSSTKPDLSALQS
jgi:hypothetical protein